MCLKFQIAFGISFVKLKHTLHVHAVQIYIVFDMRPMCVDINRRRWFRHRQHSRYDTIQISFIYGFSAFLELVRLTHVWMVCRVMTSVVMTMSACMMHVVLLFTFSLKKTLAKKRKWKGKQQLYEDQPKETMEKKGSRMQNNVFVVVVAVAVAVDTTVWKVSYTIMFTHFDNYHTESFVFKSNLTSFTTHRHITNFGLTLKRTHAWCGFV